jgi:ABC-type oligopeptide transport system substrate-binding subunit
MAGMATHYEIGPDGKTLTFYLRGHPHPKGVRLPDIESLPPEFSHGEHTPPDTVPARWSDGSIVTAGDFVYGMRRIYDPKAASAQYWDRVIVNSADIAAGKRRPEELGVSAPDDFTLHIDLTAPAQYFLVALAFGTAPIPRMAVEKARAEGRPDAWATPGNIIGNGPFVLTAWRPYDYIEITRSATYYGKNLVRLEKIRLLPLSSGPPVINLYRAGEVQALYTDSLPLSLAPALESKADFRRDRQYGMLIVFLNLREPPFDNQLVRWAVNMAIDKSALGKYWQTEVQRSFVPAMPGYTPPQSRIVAVNGKNYDVMAHDLAGARELLRLAGYSYTNGKHLSFTINCTNNEQGLQTAEIVRGLLKAGLKAEIRVNPMEQTVMAAGTTGGTAHGASVFAWTADSADPYMLLGPELVEHYGGYRHAEYFSQLKAANQTIDAALRLRKLAECEARLMGEMPIIPLTAFPAVYLQKPYVRGLTSDQLGRIWFRYAWIDTEWKQ